MTTSATNRGKFAEGKVKAKLKSLETGNCTHYRFPDAHAGSFSVTPCDFMVMRDSKLTLLEVKQVQHNFRLPHGNFSPDQLARMRNWKLAGASAWVLVYFAPITAWRLVEADYFLVKQGGSWDFRAFPTMTLDEAFDSILLP